ncbi:hypothetical protein [Rhizobiales bacterium]|uniref:hypothetical protein n=1 Tax=Rhizobium nepotum TaxID=1035271 RepID=UPI000DD88B2F
MFKRFTLADFENTFQNKFEHFLGRVSFEARSIEIPVMLKASEWKSFTVFRSSRRSRLANNRFETIEQLWKDDLPSPELDTADPLLVARTLREQVLKFAALARGQSALIDVTSFRREELLILFSILKNHDLGDVGKWRLGYVGTQDMGRWLSGKVTAVRSVVGFAGDMWPSKSSRLVIMMGFELERARSIVDAYEPGLVILGFGKRSESISETLYSRNAAVVEQLASDIGGDVKRFEFSARDPSQVVLDLEDALGDDTAFNTILAPLHTKLSTLGAGMYASKHSEVQICYAAVDEYNEDEYSKPGTAVYVLPLQSILGD